MSVNNNLHLIYGPVRSRRLGYSLGVDIVPLKTCSFDCIFCELQRRTDILTLERKPYASKELVLEAINRVLPSLENSLDSITFSGSGEPTLNSELGEILFSLKKRTRVSLTVFTNSTLLHIKEVREELSLADRVKCTLSTVTPELFNIINRPVPGLTLEMVIDGIVSFFKSYKGELWLEIMILKGFNDSEEEMKKIYETISHLPVSLIHLNRPVRVSTEPGLMVIKEEELQELSDVFHPFKVLIV